jgi:membrane protein DedA with SNARE-associated domain
MQFVLTFHNILRWAVLVFGLWTLLNALTGVFGIRVYTANDNRSNLFFMISCDIQFLLGIILYFANGWFERLKDLGNNMKDPYTRFFTMEHMSMMIIAWILVHIGRASVKKAGTDSAKHKKMLLFFGLALLLILASIPWPFREAIAKPLLRGF